MTPVVAAGTVVAFAIIGITAGLIITHTPRCQSRLNIRRPIRCQMPRHHGNVHGHQRKGLYTTWEIVAACDHEQHGEDLPISEDVRQWQIDQLEALYATTDEEQP